MDTRIRIIDTAILLFNEKGTKAVTTNHIAAAAGISPGNLYYHFRNKEEIIRAIFERMDTVGLEQYQRINSDAGPGTVKTMNETFVMIQRFNWRYRFFKREVTSLVNGDPILKQAFVQTHRAMRILVRESLDRSIEQGLLRALPRRSRDLLAEEIWLITLFWPNYLEIGGEEVAEATLQRGSELLRAVLAPHMIRRPRSAASTRKRRSAHSPNYS